MTTKKRRDVKKRRSGDDCGLRIMKKDLKLLTFISIARKYFIFYF
jgi:hypothetical protein